MDILDIIQSAENIQQATEVGSVTPQKVGKVMVDILRVLNEYQTQSGALAIQKIYTSELAMRQDVNPTSDLTNIFLKIGQLVVIVPTDPTDSTAGNIYLFSGTDGQKSTWHFVTKIGKFNELYARVLSNETAIANLQNVKADVDGKYPQLTSGFANNLAGRGEATESEFSFRASGGKSIEDGTARISELRGNGVVWNQVQRNGDFSEGKKGWSVVGGDSHGIYEIVDGIAEMTLTSEPTSGSWGYIAHDSKPCVVGHKYLISADINIPKATNVVIYGQGVNVVSQQVPANTWTRVNGFHVATRKDNFVVYPHAFNGGYTTGDVWKMRNFVLYDLTLMFGAGDEPTTIEEYYARKPIGVDECAYNAGTLIPFNAEGIKSVGFNAWDEQWELGDYNGTTGEKLPDTTVIRSKNLIKVLPNTQYYISVPTSYGNTPVRQRFYTENGTYLGYEGQSAKSGIFTTPSNCGYVGLTIHSTTYNNDICIHLVHTGYRNGEYQPYEDFVRSIDTRIKEAFPNGMKPWDKVYNKNGKGYIVKGSGEVAMNTLTGWGASVVSSYGHTTLYANAPKDALKADINNKGCLLCSNAPSATWSDMYAARAQGIGMSDVYIRIYIDSLTDVASAQAYFQDATLWYELADEYKEVIEYDEPFNLDYEVWDFGTEQIVASEPSAPINADIIYQFNAVDTIRNNQLEIEQLKAMIATMQAQMASMTTPASIEEI